MLTNRGGGNPARHGAGDAALDRAAYLPLPTQAAATDCAAPPIRRRRKLMARVAVAGCVALGWAAAAMGWARGDGGPPP